MRHFKRRVVEKLAERHVEKVNNYHETWKFEYADDFTDVVVDYYNFIQFSFTLLPFNSLKSFCSSTWWLPPILGQILKAHTSPYSNFNFIAIIKRRKSPIPRNQLLTQVKDDYIDAFLTIQY